MNLKKVLMIVLAFVMLTSIAFAAGTPAGTEISNYATGAYKDANGNAMAEVTSNTVTTIVSQVAGVDITPVSSSQNLVLFGTTTFPLTLTNTGNGDDVFDLSRVIVETGGGENTAKIYHDANGNGVKDSGESEVSATAEINADSTYDLVVVVENIDGSDGSSATVKLTGKSQFNSSVSDAVSMNAKVSTSVFTYTMVADVSNPQPGDVVTYTVSVSNTGSALAKEVTVSSDIAVNSSYVAGSMTVAGVTQTDADDTDGGTFTSGVPSDVSLLLGNIASGASVTATFQVIINDDVPVNTSIPIVTEMLWKNILDEIQSKVVGNATGATLTVAQIYFVAVGADGVDGGDPSDYVTYGVAVTNTGNGPDVINITNENNLLINWRFYYDTNVNGKVDEGEKELSDTNNDEKIDMGTMAQGDVVYIVAQGQIPAGTADETISVLTVTATSAGNSSESDEGKLTFTVTAPILTLVKSVLPAGNQPPGTILTYTVIITNVGTGEATNLVISDDIPENTTYQNGTIKFEDVAQTDNDDETDNAKFNGDTIVLTIPTLDAGDSKTIEFKTKIN